VLAAITQQAKGNSSIKALERIFKASEGRLYLILLMRLRYKTFDVTPVRVKPK
jgi:hypothetical protein